MKKIFGFLALLISAASITPVALAQDAQSDAAKVEREMAIFDKLMGVFDTGDAAPIDGEQLALARITAGHILPEGTYGKIMEKTFDQIFLPMLGLFSQMGPAEISAATGVDGMQVFDLDDTSMKRVGELLDPNAEARSAKVLELMAPLMKDTFSEVEPLLREGMARAYARKFSGGQLRELNSFFKTPTGSFYAAESFLLMADPELTNATMQAMPAIIEKAMRAFPAMKDGLEDIPGPKTLADLSDEELAELAQLLSADVAELKEYRDKPPE